MIIQYTSRKEKKMNENAVENRNNMILGAIFILIGLIFLTQNISGFDFWNWNWWALFILLPALASLNRAWEIYRAQGQANEAMRGPLVGGLVLLLAAAIFLFDLSWGTLWPLFLILFGLGALISQS
jgi:cation transport ATPase